MKHTYTFALLALLSIGSATAQCTDWVNPEPGGGWSDFTTTFGGAPCDDGSGCPINEISDFQVWADEAYAMVGVQQGGTYTFSACNGVGGTAWDLSFTVIAPSGAVDASGLDNGSICALTFTASESGDYLVVVSEAGVACGASPNQDTDNGFPTMTCASGQTLCGGIGIRELSTLEMTMAPNPANDRVKISALNGTYDVNVFSSNGQRVIAERFSNSTTLDVNGLEAGVYVVEVRDVRSGDIARERLVKQ